VESGDEEEDDLKVAAADSDSTEVEQASEDDELALLLRDNARLKAEGAALTAQRVTKLRRDHERRTACIAALLRAEVDVGNAPTVAAAAAAAGEQTPSRALLRRSLNSQLTVGRKPPSAATVPRQAAIEELLPDIDPAGDPVSAVIAPVLAPAVVGSDRASATITHVVPAAHVARRTPYRPMVAKPEKFSGDDPGQNERVASWVSEINRFFHYMRQLTLFSWTMGVQKVLRFASLQEAISTAEEAEADFNFVTNTARSSAPYSSSSFRSGDGAGRARGSGRAATESLNNLQGECSDEGEGSETAPRRGPGARVNAFRHRPGPTDGRYKLSEKEQRMLYDEKRCYRCYGQHPVGRGQPPGTKPVMKVAPKPLN